MCKYCSCFIANMRYGSPSRYTKGSNSRSSFLTMFFKMMTKIIPDLKSTFGHQNDERRDNPAGIHIRTRMLGESTTWISVGSRKYKVRPCVTFCSKTQNGPYPLCGSCERYVKCSQGYVSLIIIGWYHVCNANVGWLNQWRIAKKICHRFFNIFKHNSEVIGL